MQSMDMHVMAGLDAALGSFALIRVTKPSLSLPGRQVA